MSKYEEFDSRIFDITRIMIDGILTDGQREELLKVMEKIDAACQDGSLSGDDRQKLLQTMADCGMEPPSVPVDQTELEKRLAAYIQAEDFQRDIADLAQDYRSQGLPVPPAEQLREEAVAEARKGFEAMLACEARGHIWKEKADPENGTSELTCRRCGKTEHLRW